MPDAPIVRVKATDRLESSLSAVLNIPCAEGDKAGHMAAIMNNTVEAQLGFKATNFGGSIDSFSLWRGVGGSTDITEDIFVYAYMYRVTTLSIDLSNQSYIYMYIYTYIHLSVYWYVCIYIYIYMYM